MTEPDATSVQFLLDRIAISDLLTNYALAVDTQDWDLYRAQFTSDAHIDYSAVGGAKGTLDEVVDYLSGAMQLFEMSQHLISNQQVAIDGDAATVRAMFYNPMRFTGGGDQFFLGGWYRHQLVRTAAGWRSTELVEEAAWTEGFPTG